MVAVFFLSFFWSFRSFSAFIFVVSRVFYFYAFGLVVLLCFRGPWNIFHLLFMGFHGLMGFGLCFVIFRGIFVRFRVFFMLLFGGIWSFFKMSDDCSRYYGCFFS